MLGVLVCHDFLVANPLDAPGKKYVRIFEHFPLQKFMLVKNGQKRITCTCTLAAAHSLKGQNSNLGQLLNLGSGWAPGNGFRWARWLTGRHRSVGDASGPRATATVTRLPQFPQFGLLSVQKLLQLFPALPAALGRKGSNFCSKFS